MIWALSVFAVPVFGRISRGATLTVRGLPYMTAARLSGTRSGGSSHAHPAEHHPRIVTFSLLGIGIMIILEGALDFLGLRHPAAAAELGRDDREGASRS